MSDDEAYFDDLEFYDKQFDRLPKGRKGGKRKHDARPERALEDAGITAPTSTPENWKMSYMPARFEAVWLQGSLSSFYEEELILDVLASIKGGKEANVYRCQAHPNTGEQLLAAKVYRPRQFRNLRNDQVYRDGRDILTSDGQVARRTDRRLLRAIDQKTSFGKQVSHSSWLMHEYTTLQRLAALGAMVPKPFAAHSNALLMSYIGDAQQAAPALKSVRLKRREAGRLFEEALHTIELMLANGLIHGDLSAYNILYWEGKITLIDFPQVSIVATNRHAQALFERDVTRVCDYFIAQGLSLQAYEIATKLWNRYVEVDLDDISTDGTTES